MYDHIIPHEAFKNLSRNERILYIYEYRKRFTAKQIAEARGVSGRIRGSATRYEWRAMQGKRRIAFFGPNKQCAARARALSRSYRSRERSGRLLISSSFFLPRRPIQEGAAEHMHMQHHRPVPYATPPGAKDTREETRLHHRRARSHQGIAREAAVLLCRCKMDSLLFGFACRRGRGSQFAHLR